MEPLTIAVIVAVFTLIVLFSGIPIAFGLCFVSVTLLVAFEGIQMLDVFAETFYAGLNSFVLLSIPMFILMGMAVANSPAGKDLYTGLDRWLWRVPGGLVISNIGACSIFAALSGSSPATCAAIGTMGIPEMRKRGYSDEIATGTIAAGGTLGVLIPPSIVLIVYGMATGTSIGRLFLCGIVPGFMLASLFALWALFHSYFIDKNSSKALRNKKPPTLKEKLEVLPRIFPFLAIIIGVLYVLWDFIISVSLIIIFSRRLLFLVYIIQTTTSTTQNGINEANCSDNTRIINKSSTKTSNYLLISAMKKANLLNSFITITTQLSLIFTLTFGGGSIFLSIDSIVNCWCIFLMLI